MIFEDLKRPELQEKLKSVKSVDDLYALVKEEGLELTDEQLQVISGGEEWYEPIPPCRKAGPCTTLGTGV